MKRIVCFVGALAATRLMAATPDLTFPPARLEGPALSLVESAKRPLSKPDGKMAIPGFHFRRSPRPLAALEPRFRSQMPILKPSETIDPAFVVRPDESVDYKMLILRPSVQTRR